MCQKPLSRTGHVFEEYAQGKRWNTGDQISDGVSLAYTSGTDCCDACIVQNSDYKWASVGVEGTDKEGQCYCKKPPALPNLPNLKGTDGTNWIRGTCLPSTTSRKRKKRESEQLLVSLSDLSLREFFPERSKREESASAETQDQLDRRSYGSRLRYECGLARRFYDPEVEELYDVRTIQCNWNNTWSRHDYLDECVWTQCLYPPPSPEGHLLTTIWAGDPVEFYGNATYVCAGEDLYFEWERDMAEFNVTCLPGGAWELPDEWPRCVPCQFVKFLRYDEIIMVPS